jgi:hypothetical protein
VELATQDLRLQLEIKADGDAVRLIELNSLLESLDHQVRRAEVLIRRYANQATAMDTHKRYPGRPWRGLIPNRFEEELFSGHNNYLAN